MKTKFAGKKSAAKTKAVKTTAKEPTETISLLPEGSQQDVMETVPMTESQVEVSMEAHGSESQLCEDSVAMDHENEEGKENEGAEEETPTDDEFVTPIISHDQVGYDDIKSPALAENAGSTTGEASEVKTDKDKDNEVKAGKDSEVKTAAQAASKPELPSSKVREPEFPPQWDEEDQATGDSQFVAGAASPGAECVQVSDGETAPKDTDNQNKSQDESQEKPQETEKTKDESQKGTFKEGLEQHSMSAG